MKRVTAKLGTMRKAVDWVVYPSAAGDKVTMQADSRIAQFDPQTGVGVLSKHCSNGAYFAHLNKFLGATDITVPADIVTAALDAMPKSGDELGPGVTFA